MGRLILRFVNTLPMTSWLVCMLVIDLPTRRLSVSVLSAAIAAFLFLDLLRFWSRPRRAVYLEWLDRTIDAIRQGQPLPPRIPQRLPYGWGPWVVTAMAVYILVFILIPPARYPARAVEHYRVVQDAYRAICQLYSPAYTEPDRVVGLGHLQAALDLRHFFAASLVFSIATLFIFSGPDYYTVARLTVIKPWKVTIVRRLQDWNRRPIVRLGVAYVVGSGLGLFMFTAFVDAGDSFKIYWSAGAVPMSPMFLLVCWLFSWGLAYLSASTDIRTPHKSVGVA